jgi:hypothetical protein
MRKLYVDKDRKMEILSGEDIEINNEDEQKEILTKEELEELLKEQIVEMASDLLLEYGYGGLKKGILYNVIMDHIKLRLFSGKTLSETKKEEIEIVLDNLEEIRKNFTQPIVQGILGGKNADK